MEGLFPGRDAGACASPQLLSVSVAAQYPGADYLSLLSLDYGHYLFGGVGVFAAGHRSNG